MTTKFEDFLNTFDEQAWLEAVGKLLPEIHEVDRNAMQIWFRFYPLSLFRYLENAGDKDATIHGMAIQGGYELKDQIDSSHSFLYGHRYWKEVKDAIAERAENFASDDADLTSEIKAIAVSVAAKVKANASLLTGITAIGLMTLVQTGLDVFKSSAGKGTLSGSFWRSTPAQIVAQRAKDDSQGLFGFLKTVDKKYSIVWDETQSNAKFGIINDEEIATAAARDQSRDWKSGDQRCLEGVIPVECRSASCGTCWIGVLGGQEKLSDVARRERRQMKVFGYNQPDDARPFMRLACQAKAEGNATIVIPPWNGVFGKKVYGNVEDVEFEPATEAAKQLRERIASAAAANND